MQRKILFLALLFILGSSQVIIRNTGCKKKDSQGICTQCSPRFYMDNQFICHPVNPNCRTYNSNTGACQTCYSGFALIQTTCLPGLVAETFDPNCNTFDGNICVKCSVRHYLDSDSKCKAVDASCRDYNEMNGFCTSCFNGFELNANNGRCQVAPPKATAQNCFKTDSNGNCEQCSFGFYFNDQRICVQKDPNCKDFDEILKRCIGCYNGFQLDNQKNCIKSQAESIENKLCKQWENNVCIACSTGSYLNQLRFCAQVNPLCLTYNQLNGHCTSCYQGFTLQVSTGACIVSDQPTDIDPFCKKFDNQNNCLQCGTRYYLKNARCTEADPLCKAFDLINGACTDCFPGYALNGAICSISVESVTDPYCKTWKDGICTECAFGTFFNNFGNCQLVDPLCKTFDQGDGRCLTCYPSFLLISGKCIKDQNNEVSDSNCAEFINGICSKCSRGFYFGNNGKCLIINPNCKSFNEVLGVCSECYLGFGLINGDCQRNADGSSILDPNCAQFVQNVCTKCSKNHYFSAQGRCLQVSPDCKTFDPLSGRCESCFQSFVLQNGACVEDKDNVLSDPLCSEWLEGICIQCAPRSFINVFGKCQNVSPKCNTFRNIDGKCTSCFPGFSLNEGQCSESVVPDSCSEIDPSTGICKKCGSGSYLQNGKCIQIDLFCSNFNQNTLTCLNCYDGYSILNGVCQLSQVEAEFEVENCFAYDENTKSCIKCFDRFFLNGNRCSSVSVFCKNYDDNSGQCTDCYGGFMLSQGKCEKV